MHAYLNIEVEKIVAVSRKKILKNRADFFYPYLNPPFLLQKKNTYIHTGYIEIRSLDLKLSLFQSVMSEDKIAGRDIQKCIKELPFPAKLRKKFSNLGLYGGE